MHEEGVRPSLRVLANRNDLTSMISMPVDGFKPLLSQLVEQDVSPAQYRAMNDTNLRVCLHMHVLKLVTSGKDLVKAIGVSAEGLLTAVSIEPRGFIYHSVFPAEQKNVRFVGL